MLGAIRTATEYMECVHRIPFSSCNFAFPRLNVLHHEVRSRRDCTSAWDEGVDGAGLGPAASCWVMTGLGWPPFAMPPKSTSAGVSYSCARLPGVDLLSGPDVVGT